MEVEYLVTVREAAEVLGDARPGPPASPYLLIARSDRRPHG